MQAAADKVECGMGHSFQDLPTRSSHFSSKRVGAAPSGKGDLNQRAHPKGAMKLKEAGFEADVREAVTRSGLHLNIGETQVGPVAKQRCVVRRCPLGN